MLPATTKSSNDFGFDGSDSLALWEREGLGPLMSNKIFCLALCVLLFALYVPAEAQQQARVPKIGVLSGGSRSASGPSSRLELIRQGVRELGYVEGKNITIVYRSAEEKFERLPALVDELIGLKVDVLVMSSTPAALAAKKSTGTIPIVFIGVSDPVAAGLVDSLARPGGNVTGFTAMTSELAGKRLSCSRKLFPSSPEWRCCGIHGIQMLRVHGKKANYQHANWACSFFP